MINPITPITPNLVIAVIWLFVSINGVGMAATALWNEQTRRDAVLHVQDTPLRRIVLAGPLRSLIGRMIYQACCALAAVYAVWFSESVRSPAFSTGTIIFAVLLIVPSLYFVWATLQDLRDQRKLLRAAIEEQQGKLAK